MTAAVPLVERLAEVLRRDGWIDRGEEEDLARALLPVVEQAVAEARRGALMLAAKEAEERGDIGKEGGCEAWEWLRIRAGRIGGAE